MKNKENGVALTKLHDNYLKNILFVFIVYLLP